MMNTAKKNMMIEMSFVSEKKNLDRFSGIEMDVMVSCPDGNKQKVPAFWAGGDIWKVRYASPVIGGYSYETVCSDRGNSGLHGQKGKFSVTAYDGDNPLFAHGPLRVAKSGRHFEHFDGTPFFWLADTWWMGLCGRFKWPQDFQLLTRDRREKGFNVVQIVAGPLPGFISSLDFSIIRNEVNCYIGDERTANEGGWPWEHGWTTINPRFFDAADTRIMCLVDSGIAPCIVGAWGSYIDVLGPEKIKRHWRYLIARWGALPVIWCIAGEALVHIADSNPLRKERCRKWTDVVRYVREIDPFHRLVTVHPSVSDDGCTAKKMLEDPRLLDFDMLQIGHEFDTTKHLSYAVITQSRTSSPVMPVINGEVNYEGIFGANWQNIQRFFFWTSVLSGTAGHTYGSQGIHCFQTREFKHVHDCYIFVSEQACWEDDYRLPGASQMGIGKRLLEKYDWQNFEPISVDRIKNWEDARVAPFCSGIPGTVWVMYLPFDRKYMGVEDKWILVGDPDMQYECRSFFISPRTGKPVHEKVVEVSPGRYARVNSPETENTDKEGYLRIPCKITGEDWVYVVEIAR